MALQFTCKVTELPTYPPEINIPHFGAFVKSWGTIGKIPDLGDLLAQLQDALAVAMAPVRRFLEMVETFAAVYQCITAIPTAILRLSPSPIFDCLKELSKVVARLLAWLPPLCYVRLAIDIAGYCMALIDAIINYFVQLDSMLSRFIASYDIAIQFDDAELLQFVNCGLSTVRPSVITALDPLLFIAPINNVLMQMFSRLLPNPKLEAEMQIYTLQAAFQLAAIQLIRTTTGQVLLPTPPGFSGDPVVQHPIIPIPPLGGMLYSMNKTRNSMVNIYNILAPIVGAEGGKVERTLPIFQNF